MPRAVLQTGFIQYIAEMKRKLIAKCNKTNKEYAKMINSYAISFNIWKRAEEASMLDG